MKAIAEDWEHIAKKKTEAIKECFPKYNPAFQGGNDKETIVNVINSRLNYLNEMITEQSDVNEKLEEELMDQKKICQELLWAKENKPK